MSKKSGLLRVVIWSIVLLIALAALFTGLRVSRSGNWWFSEHDRSEFVTVKQENIDADVRSLRANWVSGEVRVVQSADEQVHVLQRAGQGIKDKELFAYRLEGNTLVISDNRSRGWWFFSLGFRQDADLEIQLPTAQYDAIQIETTSADIVAESLSARSVSLGTTSGDIRAGGQMESLKADSTSGDILLSGSQVTGKLTLGTTSGAIKGQGLSCEALKVDTVSGSARLEGTFAKAEVDSTSGDVDLDNSLVPEHLDIETVSGRVQLSLPASSEISVSFDSVSGDLKNEFATNSGGRAQVEVETVSGDCHIVKRP